MHEVRHGPEAITCAFYQGPQSRLRPLLPAPLHGLARDHQPLDLTLPPELSNKAGRVTCQMACAGAREWVADVCTWDLQSR